MVDEDAEGVTLNGMKMLGTSAVFSNETWVGNLLPLGKDQAAESVTCAVPLNAPGVTIWTRKPYERYAISEFDAPFAWRFDETDSMVIFEEVKVPWERVFTHNDAPLSRDIYFRTPSHVMGNHQSNVRFHEKLKLILGIARKSAELNNVIHVPGVQDTLGRLAAAEAGLGGMIAGQIEEAEETECGHLFANRRHMYAALHWCTQNYAAICETVRDLMGGGPFQMPADVSVINDPNLREQFDTYWSVPGQSAVRAHEVPENGVGPARQRLRWPAPAIRTVLRGGRLSSTRSTTSSIVRGTNWPASPTACLRATTSRRRCAGPSLPSSGPGELPAVRPGDGREALSAPSERRTSCLRCRTP